jgi:hypothetical protein
MVPIGVRRITHHSTLRTTARAEALKARKPSPASPTFRAATPVTSEITRICSTLNDSRGRGRAGVEILVEAGRPRMLEGHQAGQEVEPRAVGLGRVGRGGDDGGVQARLQDQAQGDADQHGDQGGDGEPQQGAPDQAGGVLQFR